jgi:hypothetical protein
LVEALEVVLDGAFRTVLVAQVPLERTDQAARG